MNRPAMLLLTLLFAVALAAPAPADCGACPGDAKAKPADQGCAACPASDCAACPASGAKAVKGAGAHAVPTLDAAALKARLDRKEPLVVLDARSGKYDDGRRLPGAAALSPDAKPERVAELLPDKKAPIVTYCSGLKCPASGKLAAALRAAGYENVTEFPGGVEAWEKAGHPFDKAGK